jgi:hypothetical protein
VDDLDDVIKERLDAAAATISATNADQLGDRVKAHSRRQRRRQHLAVAAAIVVLVALIGGGLALARRSSTPPDRELASGSHEDVANFLAQSSDRSLKANTFTYATNSEVSGPAGADSLVPQCMQDTAAGTRASVDVRREVTEVLDPATGAPVVITTPTFDAISASQFPGVAIGKPWVSYDRLDRQLMSAFSMNPVLALRMFAVGAGPQHHPESFLTELKDTATSVTNTGDENIDGVVASHLVIVRDASKDQEVIRRRAETETEAARRRGHQPTTTVPGMPAPVGSDVPNSDDAPIDVWVGKDDGLIRRVRYSSTMHDPSGTALTFTGTLTFTDYGKPLAVETPTQDDTVPLASLPATAVVGDLATGLGCAPALPATGGAEGPSLTAPLECMQQIKEKALAGMTVQQYLDAPGNGLPNKDGVTEMPPTGTPFDTSKCFLGAGAPPTPPPDTAPAPNGTIPCPAEVGPTSPVGTLVPVPDAGPVCTPIGDKELQCLRDALSTTTVPNSPPAPSPFIECAPQPTSPP